MSGHGTGTDGNHRPPVSPGLHRKASASGWVSQASSGDCEIQRLSPYALMERQKHSHRYRLLKDGKVMAYFDTKEEMQQVLKELAGNANNPKQSHEVMRRMQSFGQALDSAEEEPESMRRSGSSRRSASTHLPRGRLAASVAEGQPRASPTRRSSTLDMQGRSRHSTSPSTSKHRVPASVPSPVHHLDSHLSRPPASPRAKGDGKHGFNAAAHRSAPDPLSSVASLAKQDSTADSEFDMDADGTHHGQSGSHYSSGHTTDSEDHQPPSDDSSSITTSSGYDRPARTHAPTSVPTPSPHTEGERSQNSPKGQMASSGHSHSNSLHDSRRGSEARLGSGPSPKHFDNSRPQLSPRKTSRADLTHTSSSVRSSSADPNRSGLGGRKSSIDRRSLDSLQIQSDKSFRKASTSDDKPPTMPMPLRKGSDSVRLSPTSLPARKGSANLGRNHQHTNGPVADSNAAQRSANHPSPDSSRNRAHSPTPASFRKSSTDNRMSAGPLPRTSSRDGRANSSPQLARKSSTSQLPQPKGGGGEEPHAAPGHRPTVDPHVSPVSSQKNSPKSQHNSPKSGHLAQIPNDVSNSPRVAPTLEPIKRPRATPPTPPAPTEAPEPAPQGKEEPEKATPPVPTPSKKPKGPVLTEAQKAAGPKEKVIAWYYDDPTNTWTYKELEVRLASEFFSQGGMRQAFQMVICDPDGTERSFVAKLYNEYAEKEIIAPDNSMFGRQDPERLVNKSWALRTLRQQTGCEFEAMLMQICFPDDATMFSLRHFLTWHRRLKLFKIDVEMQGFCQTYAAEFNKRNPPKPVVFLDAFLIVCVNRPNQPIFACEPMIQGEFVKHNNNCGQVQERSMERNTPQAFSHFTYWFSRNKYIIVDIQGVNDTYTDPQVHSVDRTGFGMGNLGQEGIDSFFRTHRCNNICTGLGLVPPSKKTDEAGTVYH